MGLMDKFHNLNECRENSKIYDTYYNDSIDENIVYLESRNGNDFTGNIFRITEELSTGEYGDLKIYVFANKQVKSRISEFKKNYNLNIYKIITDETEACQILEKAKYIFTDSGIMQKYIKKDGQIVVNTWHGTPLKLMGFDNPSEKPNIGIIQRCFFFSDYLLYPNEYMMEKMLNAYMIDTIYPGTILLEGYPRNSVFLDENRRAQFKNKLDLEGMEVFVYMPTFKGIVSDRKDIQQRNDVDKFLEKIDESLKDNQILFVKFHPYNQSKINFSKFNNVRAFPKGYESYDLLNVCDCLITDYSSVFFDYATTRRKIIIFNYDEEEYLKDRGIYIPLEDLPFPKVQTVDELIGELNLNKDYDDDDFVNEYCGFDSITSARDICRCVINNEDSCECRIIENSKKNIMVYGDGLEDNDTTKSLIQFVQGIDKSRYDVYVSFKRWHMNIKENHIDTLKRIPGDVKFAPLSYNTTPTVKEKLNLDKFLKDKGNMDLYESIKPLFEKSFKKHYYDIEFDLIIDYNTSNPVESLIYANSGHRTAAVISDKSNRDIYSKFDEVYGMDDEIKLD